MLTLILAAIWVVLWNTKRCPWDVNEDSIWSGLAGVLFFVLSLFCAVTTFFKHSEGLMRQVFPMLDVMVKWL
jgi:hypothetical protein